LTCNLPIKKIKKFGKTKKLVMKKKKEKRETRVGK